MPENVIYDKWGQPIAPPKTELTDPTRAVGSREWLNKQLIEQDRREWLEMHLAEKFIETATTGSAYLFERNDKL